MRKPKLNKGQITGIITIVMTVAFFFSLLWGYVQYQQSRRALALLENEYQRDYYNYMATVKEMSLTAGKALSANALQKALLLGRLNALADQAVEHMTALPLQHERYQQSVAYLNRVGDYAASLGQTLARGETLLAQDQQNLTDIYGQLRNIYGQLRNIYAKVAEMETPVADGKIVFAAALQGDSWWQAVRTALSGYNSRAAAGTAALQTSADGYFSQADTLLDGLEPLVYSGKYSGHMLSLAATGLDGLRTVTMEEALSTAHAFLSRCGWQNLTLVTQEEIDSSAAIPVYSFHFTVQGANPVSLYVTVSRSGGKVISFFNERKAAAPQVTAEKAIAEAERLLAASGFSSLKLISQQSFDNELLLKYAYCPDDILCYPDSVEIKVALDIGLVTALNAREYWMNNHQRTLPQTMNGLESALATLGDGAQVNGTALAFISDGAGGETLCHEIRHMVDGEEYCSYIGAEHLQEEEVLRCYTADDGCFYTQ